ncbi:hypothetical protein EZY14_007350 [Kordia sp. TARA_039_SRF]|nr:hypothetical protein EZY14_007350 [Kordia sp. TARA_039_SRF]
MNIKHCIRVTLALFLLLLATISCEKESVYTQIEASQESKVKRISLQELNLKLGSIAEYKSLSSLFEGNRKGNKTQQKTLDASDQAWIMTDEIVMIEREDATFYTFRIGTQTEQNEFYNFVLGINYDNTLRSMRILEYTPSDSWLSDTSAPFVGEVKAQGTIFSEQEIADAIAAKSSSQCITGISGDWECNLGNEGHYEGHPNCTNGTSWNYVVTVHYGACPPELTSGDDTNSHPVDTTNTGGNGGSGGNVNPNDNFDDDGCVPTIENPCEDDETTVLTPREPQENDEINCEEQKQRLLNLVNNETVKEHIDALKLGIHSDLSSNYKEDGVRFAKTGLNQYTPRYPSTRDGNSLDYEPDYMASEVLSVHIHQTKFYNAAVSSQPFFNAPVPSDEDVIELMKNIKYIQDNNPLLANEVTQIVMTEAGVFAIVIKPEEAIAALNALQDTKTEDKFRKSFNKKVLKDWDKINQNAGEVCDANCLNDVANKFNKFMNKLKIGGTKVEAKVLRAVIGENNEITGWLCDE